MKFLVLAACVAAASAQGFFGLQAHPNGAVTPIDEPAVAAARADHLATKFGGYAPAYGSAYGYDAYGYSGAYEAAPLAYAAPAIAPVSYAAAAPLAPVSYGYSGPLHIPQLVAHPNGAVTPADEPAVAAARADHLIAKGAAYAAAAPVIAAAPAVAAPVVAAAPVAYAAAAPIHIPTLVAHPNGAVTPADEPAVAAARADHLAAKDAAYAAAAPIIAAAPAVAAPIAPYAYSGPLHIPQLVAHPNGAVTPADEPAVAAARADHLIAKDAAYAAAAPVIAAAPAIAPVAYAEAAPIAPYAYSGPLHIPQLVAHPNGAVTPADEPAVVAARADHLAAHGVVGGVYASAPVAYGAGYAAGFHGLVAHPNGAVVPVDEPAVAAARADHLAAHGY